MVKRFATIDGTDFFQLVTVGAERLTNNVERINALNVFPVPDGDTGTNMNLTMSSGIAALHRLPNDHLGQAAEIFSKGLLMGARGNSGVILSQLFRGFAKGVQGLQKANVQQFAQALQYGVDTAYKAVMRPVEGTILSVAKEAAKQGLFYARRVQSINELLEKVLQHGQQALDYTPEQLPVLKQTGVVDAGGQGLICIYEGMFAALTGEALPMKPQFSVGTGSSAKVERFSHEMLANETVKPGHNAQAMMSAEDIVFGYCTEFIVKLVPGKVAGVDFDEEQFKEQISAWGDSLLVVADDDLVKVHIHAEYPGEAMSYAQQFGDLTRIKIENMREQHAEASQYSAGEMSFAGAIATSEQQAEQRPEVKRKAFGAVTVSMGDGISEIFTSLGVDHIIAGGQTMNPSTEDLVQAVLQIEAETVFVLPNNSNIILAAKQAMELVHDRQMIVIPTKTVSQGMAAMMAFRQSATAEQNEATMTEAIEQVRSGQITQAVRDTSIDDVVIETNDYIGIMDGAIVAANKTMQQTWQQLIDALLKDDGDMITIIAGELADSAETERMHAYIQEQYAEVEIELLSGGQPLYHYLISVE